MSTRSLVRPSTIAAGCLSLALVVYALSPVMTLCSVASALQNDDIGSVRGALDWRTVRSGLKADLGPSAPISLASAHPATVAEDELPGFGESFATTIVSHVVDDVVTPEHLVAMLSQAGGDHDVAGAGPYRRAVNMLARVQHVGFTSPTRFEASIRLGDDSSAAPVTVSMQVEKWQWKITRIHLPDELLNHTGSESRT